MKNLPQLNNRAMESSPNASPTTAKQPGRTVSLGHCGRTTKMSSRTTAAPNAVAMPTQRRKNPPVGASADDPGGRGAIGKV